jgi:membrane-associated phospholipid phosphatase
LWLAAGTMALLATLATLIDLPLARWVEGTADERWIPGDILEIVELSEAFAHGSTVALLILAAVLLDPRGWRVTPRLAICVFGAGLIADIGKVLVGRWRPGHANLSGGLSDTFTTWAPSLSTERLPGLEDTHDIQSFPSGHTTTAFGLAIGLSLLYPRGRWLFFAVAILAAYQRIDSQSHFLSDVLAGACVAFVVGAVTTGNNPLGRWLRRIENPVKGSSP